MASQTSLGQLARDDSNYPVGWHYLYSTGTGVVVVKNSPGVLHSISFNKATVGLAVTLYDSTSAQTGTFGIITIPASPQPVTLFYDVTLTNGLVLNVGTSSDLTISFI
jgi:hypothetical protein